MRRVSRRGRIQVDVESLCCLGARRIAVSVTVVVGAASSNIFTPRRLRKLPDFGECDSTLCGTGRMLRKRTARRGGTGIVDRPVDDHALSGALTNIFGGHYFVVLGRRN